MKISLVDRWSIVDRLVDDLRKHCRWYIFLVARYRNRTGRYGAQLFFLPRVLRYFSYFPTGDFRVEFSTRVHIGVWKIFTLRVLHRLIFFKLLLQNGIIIYICYLAGIYFRIKKKRKQMRPYIRLWWFIMEIVHKDSRFKISTMRTFLTKRIAFTIWIGS